jgi:predicted dehydrogenase
MNQRTLPGLLVSLLLACTLGAQTPRRATVAVITNHEGAHLSAYFPALAESAETATVLLADPSGKTITEARQALGPKLAATYSSARDLFAQHRPQLTLISLEPKLAPAAIEAALDAGSHVLAEKPACLSIAEFARLSQKANTRKLHLMLALANRLNPETQFALDLIRQKKLGKIYGVELHLIADQTRLGKAGYEKSWYAQKARGGGGHLIWLGLHWIDIAMYLTGADVTDVAGFTTNIGGQPLDVEDSATLTLKFSNGALGTMTSGYYLDKGYHSHVKIWGATGWIEMNRHGAAVPFRYYSTTDAKPEIKTYTAPESPAGYSPYVAACVRAALGLEPPPITTNESLRILTTVFTAYRAAETGQTQRIPGTH